MNLQSELTAHRAGKKNLTVQEQANLKCRLAKEFEKAGDYESAADAINDFWPDRGDAPDLRGLDPLTQARLTLRIGNLIGWLGGTQQNTGSQETAKNLITKSIEMFESVGNSVGVAEARADLALCYWREGAFDEARINLSNALNCLNDNDNELKACILIRAGMVELRAGQLSESLRIHNDATCLIEKSDDATLKGAFHNQLATIYENLSTGEYSTNYIDRALIEYSAASFHFEQAGNSRYLASVENNLGFLFFMIRRYAEAHLHLDRARQIFGQLGHKGNVAQVDETRARTFLAEGKLADAERLVKAAVRTLEKGDEQAVLAEALTTYGIVKARRGQFARARELFNRAIEIAETCGDLEGAGRAKLSIIEEMADQTSALDLVSTFESASDLLQKSQDPSATKRLIASARRVIESLKTGDTEIPAIDLFGENFSLRQRVRSYEKALIERALRDSGGAVTMAAHMLGFKHHQSLISLINSRHRDLLGTRSAVRKRRSHIFSKPRKLKRVAAPPIKRSTSQISILHVEDHKLVADLVNDLLAAEHWQVQLCTDGDSALLKLTGNEHYDALVVDNELQGLSGLELIQRTRKMTHRRRMPIIMLSASDYETDAWRVGVDAFLKKPEQITALPSTINRLIKEGSKHA
jgi:CheY-like chemotaxis protein